MAVSRFGRSRKVGRGGIAVVAEAQQGMTHAGDKR